MAERKFGHADDDIDRTVFRLVALLGVVRDRVVVETLQALQRDSRTVGKEFGSPIWTGRYAASHKVSIGEPAHYAAPPMDNPPRWPEEPAKRVAATPLSEASRITQRAHPFQTVYISNAVPYARRIEEGHSPKAPADGPYHATAAYIRAKAKQIVSQSVRRGLKGVTDGG